MSNEIANSDKIRALRRAAGYRPKLIVGAVVLSLIAALLEGVGIGFVLPIVELAEGTVEPSEAGGVLGLFAQIYLFLDIPFTLGHLVIGVSAVMTLRYTMSFLVGWVRGAIRTYYLRHLQQESLERTAHARTAYFDREGSDDILNAIVTQSEYASSVLTKILLVLEEGLLSLTYFTIALIVAPILTLWAVLVFGVITVVFNAVFEAGYAIGDRVAEANERIQEHAQASTQGIRDVKLFGLQDEILDKFDTAVNQFTHSRIKYFRNQSAIQNFYQMLTAVALFVLIYVSLIQFTLTLGELGLFIFAIFRLGPKLSSLYNRLYKLDADLPHLVRTQKFIDDLEQNREPDGRSRPIPETVRIVEFNEVGFSYESSNEIVLENISFRVERDEFVAFVGPSGAGKSTIVSLLARLYEPESGMITTNGIPIDEFDIAEWRSKIAVVRQDPYIFNDTLRKNLTIGKPQATTDELKRISEIAQISEFLETLPDGYETLLGDNGVRLSGGQRQRVALARALLVDAEILVLDEATSDLDTGIESEVQRAIESMARDYAMIAIAHRISTVQNADRIYTIEGGRITEKGPHQKLLANDGTYSELYSMQQGSR